MAKLVQLYMSAVERSPLTVNACTGFLISSVGDIVCQKLLERQKRLNVSRIFEMGCIRAMVITPFIQIYYPFLRKLAPDSTLIALIKRVCYDQLIGSPMVITLVFSTKALLHNEIASLPKKVYENLPLAWLAGLKYWPFIHLITFSIIPAIHQQLFAHVASLYWMVLLSYYSHAS